MFVCHIWKLVNVIMENELIYEKKGLKLYKHISVVTYNVYYVVEFNGSVLRYADTLEKATDCYSCKLSMLEALGLIST